MAHIIVLMTLDESGKYFIKQPLDLSCKVGVFGSGHVRLVFLVLVLVNTLVKNLSKCVAI